MINKSFLCLKINHPETRYIKIAMINEIYVNTSFIVSQLVFNSISPLKIGSDSDWDFFSFLLVASANFMLKSFESATSFFENHAYKF